MPIHLQINRAACSSGFNLKIYPQTAVIRTHAEWKSCRVLWIFSNDSGPIQCPWKFMICVLRLCPCASSDYSGIILFDRGQTYREKKGLRGVKNKVFKKKYFYKKGEEKMKTSKTLLTRFRSDNSWYFKF